MTRCLLLFLWLTTTFEAPGQSVWIDSMRQQLPHVQKDTLRVLHLLQMGNYFEAENLDSSEVYYRQALALSRELNAPFFEGKTISWFTDVLNKEGKLAEALELNRRGYAIGKMLDHTRLTVASISNLAATFQYMAEYDSTVKYQIEALPVLEKMGDEDFYVTGLLNIAGTYRLLKQYRLAHTYATEGLNRSRRRGDVANAIAADLTLGVIVDRLDSTAQALKYYEDALSIAEENNLPFEQSVSLLNIGATYVELERPDNALQYLNRAIGIARELGDEETQARILLATGQANNGLGHYNAAIDVLRPARDLAEKHGFRDALKSIYLATSDAALALGDREAYLDQRRKFDLLSDSLLNESLLQHTSEFETKYQTARKEEEISRLEREAEIRQLQLRQRKGIIIGLGLGLGLLAGIGFLYLQNLKSKEALTKQHLRLQQNEILQLRQEKQLTAVDAMLRGQEAERSRLARDLHDGLGGMLSGVRQTLDAMKGNQIISEESARGLNRALEMLDSSIGELRRVARNMMPEALLKFGLHDAIRDLCDAYNDAGKTNIQYQSFGIGDRLPPSQEVILFRVIQELLNNATKHAGASRILVQLVKDDQRIHLTVEDNGKGFDPEALTRSPGIGWLNIKSRVDYLDGTLHLRSGPGKGTTIEIEFTGKERT